jgi:VIT1/CCC1 family predicted Fe2+/Mn2+ transporter
MIQFFLIVILVLVLTAIVAIFIAVLSNKKAKKATVEMQTLHEAFWMVKEKAERLQNALDKTAKVKGEANAERKELAETLNSDLVNRANNLFS